MQSRRNRNQNQGGSDSRFFTTTKKGENAELKIELQSQDRTKKRDAVKKVIANMTVGKDVSMLFADVVNCMQTGNIELKKLVYLYLINYAKSNPDLAILAVNTFVRDASDNNPLIRALAVRTMGCIRVERITEYLCEPLRRCLRDDDPYVRKTAAICVAKLYDINPEMVEDQGFLDVLRDLICDANPTVVANAVAALAEIAETSGRDVFMITTSVLQKLLAALNECTEWGQVFILDALSTYTPADSREAEGIIERVTPRLQHANAAVVMSAIKVVLSYLDLLTSTDTVRQLSRKLAPPLVTLLSAEPEIQYVALRNINLIVQKRPTILAHEIKVFFCKYNDAIFVKLEKLEIIVRLVSDRNIEQVLLEFKEYASEVDVDFVRRAVRAIGRCAIKLERAAERCINVLLELIQTQVDYVVQEAVIVIKDIFRRYPNRYESIIATLCENLTVLDEPEAKASMIWIIGEYAARIDNADELLDSFLESFYDETAAVQLQLLTATVKLFLTRPTDTQEMVQRVLNMATEDSDNPDLRDRGYIYWRLLSTDPDAAKAVVLADKPVIADDTYSLEPELLDTLIRSISTLASVYHKPADAFVVRTALGLEAKEEDDDLSDYDDDEGGAMASGAEYDDDDGYGNDAGAGAGAAPAASSAPVDLLDMGGLTLESSQAPAPAPAAAGLDLFGGDAAAAAGPAPKTLFTAAADGGGVQLSGAFARRDGNLVLDLEFGNQGQTPIHQFAVQVNKSVLGLAPTQAGLQFPQPVGPGGVGQATLTLAHNPAFVVAGPATLSVQAAMKNMASNHVFYFTPTLPFQALFTETGQLQRPTFIQQWKSIDESKEIETTLTANLADLEGVKRKLAAANVFFIANTQTPAGLQVLYFSSQTMFGLTLLCELTVQPGNAAAKCCVKAEQPQFAPLMAQAVEALLR